MEDETAYVTIDAMVTMETVQDDADTNRQEESFIVMDEETAFMTLGDNLPVETVQEDIDSNHQEDIFADMPALVAWNKSNHEDSDKDSDSSDNSRPGLQPRNK